MLGLAVCVCLCARMVEKEPATWADERWVGGGGEAKKEPRERQAFLAPKLEIGTTAHLLSFSTHHSPYAKPYGNERLAMAMHRNRGDILLERGWHRRE